MRSMWSDSNMRIAVGRVLGGVLCVSGFIVMGIGWRGMARVSCPDCQLPYLISGGAVGLGLVLLGIGLLVVSEIRAARERIKDHLERLVDVARGGPAPAAARGPAGAGLEETVVSAGSHE